MINEDDVIAIATEYRDAQQNLADCIQARIDAVNAIGAAEVRLRLAIEALRKADEDCKT